MSHDNRSESLDMKKKKRFLRLGFKVAILICIGLYLFVIFRPGIEINIGSYTNEGKDIGGFWRKKLISEKKLYEKGNHSIEVIGRRGENEVVQVRIFDNQKVLREFIVEFDELETWNRQPVLVKDENDNVLVKGVIQKEGEYFIIYGLGEREPIDQYNYIKNVRKYIDIVELVDGKLNSFEGEPALFGISLILFFFSWLTIKHPDVLFMMRHALSVKDPEPTELYLIESYIGGALSGIIGLYLAVQAIKGL